MGLTGSGTTEDDLADAATSREALTEHLRALGDEQLAAKEQQYGDQAWSQAERFVLLRTIDSLWVEHLTEVDDMRRGIGLRGYAQQDPLNEFRKEAFRLYEELRDFIRRQVAATILRVTVTVQQPVPTGVVPLPGPGQPARTAATAGARRHGRRSRHRKQPDERRGGKPRSGSSGPVAGPLPADLMRGAREAAVACPPVRATGPPTASARATPPAVRGSGATTPAGAGPGNKYKKCHGR